MTSDIKTVFCEACGQHSIFFAYRVSATYFLCSSCELFLNYSNKALAEIELPYTQGQEVNPKEEKKSGLLFSNIKTVIKDTNATGPSILDTGSQSSTVLRHTEPILKSANV